MTLIALILVGTLAFGFLMDICDKSPRHQWKYRNPADRTCSTCGRNEQEECHSWEYQRHGLSARGWWEVYREGDGSCGKETEKSI